MNQKCMQLSDCLTTCLFCYLSMLFLQQNCVSLNLSNDIKTKLDIIIVPSKLLLVQILIKPTKSNILTHKYAYILINNTFFSFFFFFFSYCFHSIFILSRWLFIVLQDVEVSALDWIEN